MHIVPQLHKPDSHGYSRFEASTFRQTSLHARSDAQISLVTAQGDKVTLSASSRLQATHLTYDYLGRLPGHTVAARAEKVQIETSNELAMTIQGELNQEELADIKKLIEAIRESAADVFSGRSDGLLESTLDITGLESIAGFQAELSYTREASAIRAASVAVEGTAPADPVPLADAISRPQSAESLLDKLIKAAKRLEGEKSPNELPHRFTRLFEKLAKDLALDEHDKKLAKHILAELRKPKHKVSIES